MSSACSYQNFARIAAPLNRKLRKGQAPVYTELFDKELETLETLNKKLISPPVLAVQRSQDTYTVSPDACDQQIGFVLLQKQLDGHNKPIVYWPRLLMCAGRPCDATHKKVPRRRKCRAVLFTYLEGTRFAI